MIFFVPQSQLQGCRPGMQLHQATADLGFYTYPRCYKLLKRVLECFTVPLCGSQRVTSRWPFTHVQVLYLDPKENPGAMEFFGVKPSDEPQVLVHVPNKGEKYSSGPISVEKVAGWVDDFKAGKIEKTVKSEPVPESNDGPVTVVVAKTFNEILFAGKNVLMEFYAPWCGHCKNLEPVYNELGEAFKGNDKVVIAKMDATANDVPDQRFDVKGFPTLMFISAEGEISKYEGGRTLEDFSKFLQEKVGAEPAAKEDAKDEL
jgi:protein disulfide-isomerase A1